MHARAEVLSLRHALLAVLVMAVWGTNFVVIRVALDQMPPLLFAALRFVLVLFPAVLFLKRPAVSRQNLAAYGVLIGGGQFGILYIAMRGHITPGLASLVIQMQVFFTIGLAAYLSGERVRAFQAVALVVTAAGLALIATKTDGSTTPLGLALVLFAGLSWALSNIVMRQAPNVDMLAYVVWTSLYSVPLLLFLSLVIEGWPAIREGIAHAGIKTWAAVVWQALGNTLFGYAVWGSLLSRYSVAAVAPMALLVPIFGIGASVLWLGEPLQTWKIEAVALVVTGLGINLLWPKVSLAWSRQSAVLEKA